MKILRLIVVFGLVCLSSHQALADAVVADTLVNGQSVWTVLQPSLLGNGSLDDPRIVVHRQGRGIRPFATGVGDEFSFLARDGSGVFSFYNDTTQTFHDLTFTLSPGGPPSDLATLFDCSVTSDNNTLPFSNCNFLNMGSVNSETIVQFIGGPGLAPLGDFSIELFGFDPNTLVRVQASPLGTPEPASMLLVLTGIGALMGRRKFREGWV
jgi:hypothetical protein